MKATLILIGGGEIGNGETRPVDEKVRSYSSKENPHLLFLGTASGDPESYTEAVRSVYGELSCEVEPLSIANETPSPEDLKEALAWADMMYIGGGNTKTLIKRLKETGLDQLLLKALNEREDFVLAGLSAGRKLLVRGFLCRLRHHGWNLGQDGLPFVLGIFALCF
jgi:dipeptidase E